MLIPKRAVLRIKPLLGICEIYLKTSQQPVRSLNFAVFFLEFFIEPAPGIFSRCRAERADDLVQLARLKLLNFVLPIHDDGERWCLDASKRGYGAPAAAA